jgi:hypothetical protein
MSLFFIVAWVHYVHTLYPIVAVRRMIESCVQFSLKNTPHQMKRNSPFQLLFAIFLHFRRFSRRPYRGGLFQKRVSQKRIRVTISQIRVTVSQKRLPRLHKYRFSETVQYSRSTVGRAYVRA